MLPRGEIPLQSAGESSGENLARLTGEIPTVGIRPSRKTVRATVESNGATK